MSVIWALITQSVTNAFHSSAVWVVAESALQKCMNETEVAYDVSPRTIALQSFTVSIFNFVENKFERRSLERDKCDE